MELIDEEGNLFGIVNVIDALVVLVLVAVLVAGVALVTGGSDPAETDAASEGPELATQHVTLVVGEQPAYIAGAIEAGDTTLSSGPESLTVTDVRVTPRNGGTYVALRANVTGPMQNETVSYGGAPPRLGRSLTLATDTYEIQGQIRAVGDRPELERESATVRVRTDLAESELDAIATPTPITIAGHRVGTIEDTDWENETATVEATITTHVLTDTAYFGGRSVETGATVTLPTATETISGTVESVEAADT